MPIDFCQFDHVGGVCQRADESAVSEFVTTQVDSLKDALPRQSWKTEGYCVWASGPSVLPSAFGLQPTHLNSYQSFLNNLFKLSCNRYHNKDFLHGASLLTQGFTHFAREVVHGERL